MDKRRQVWYQRHRVKTTFYIFRHGETFATKAGIWYGWKIYSANILEEGKPTLHKIGEYLQDIETDYQVSSQIKRCRQTSEIIQSHTNREFVYDKRLNEFFLESYLHLRKRLRSFLQEVEEKQYKKVAVCSHGGVIGVMLRMLTHDRSRNPLTLFQYPPPGVLSIVRDGQLEQINFND